MAGRNGTVGGWAGRTLAMMLGLTSDIDRESSGEDARTVIEGRWTDRAGSRVMTVATYARWAAMPDDVRPEAFRSDEGSLVVWYAAVEPAAT